MKLTILNHEGDVLLATKDEQGLEELRKEKTVKELTVDEITAEFNRLMAENRIAVDDDTNKIITKLTEKTENVTILQPLIGG